MSVAPTSPAPSAWAWLLLLAVTSVLIALATWQYQRADEKAALLAQLSDRLVSETLSWADADAPLANLADRPMRLRGRFLPKYRLALDNQIRAGRVGVELLVLFQPEASASAVLVNLGWVPSDRNGGVALPSGIPADGEIVGRVHQPSAFITLGEPELLANVWRVGRVEPAYWSTRWQYAIKPWVLRLDAGAPGAYLRDWSPTSAQQLGPDRHRAYAFQWLCLALAWCACWYGFWRKGLKRI